MGPGRRGGRDGDELQESQARSGLASSAGGILWVLAAGFLGLTGCPGESPLFEGHGSGGAGATNTSEGGASGGTGGDQATSSGDGGFDYPCGIDCTTIETDACHTGVCNPDTKKCSVAEEADGAACDDGKFCTLGDTCQGGACAPGPKNDCGMTAAGCHDIVCDEQAQTCSLSDKPNGTLCTNQDPCVVDATCQAGKCVGNPMDCSLTPVPDVCHSGACNPKTAMCQPEPDPAKNGFSCLDQKDLCTIGKTCSNGLCQGGVAKDCSQLTIGCQVGVCDPNSGQCTTKPAMPGTKCDDGDPCTASESCTNGNCAGGVPVTQCSGNLQDKCCPLGCTSNNDKDCNQTVPGFMGELGPTFPGWVQCEGYLDKSNVEDIPQKWGDDCMGLQYNKLLLACGPSLAQHRHIEVNKNVFRDKLTAYPETGLIVAAKDQNGVAFPIADQIYAENNDPQVGKSWWAGGNGCGENKTNLVVNNICPWEAANCFGQDLNGDRYLWIYVQ